jgi:hypothetical protein
MQKVGFKYKEEPYFHSLKVKSIIVTAAIRSSSEQDSTLLTRITDKERRSYSHEV